MDKNLKHRNGFGSVRKAMLLASYSKANHEDIENAEPFSFVWDKNTSPLSHRSACVSFQNVGTRVEALSCKNGIVMSKEKDRDTFV